MADLAEFSQTACAKCGEESMSLSKAKRGMQYHTKGVYCSANSPRSEGAEHLHYKCQVCGYDWATKTKDAAVPV